ncbi:hypothetical protein [Candidatus Venteria ishoeyi]|uniref:Uncharacterized protein n=1 Tax=Candidatus Venteria ishoeyi TaxID=1899563 RepID=A0A1H6FB21_9GAMM|nr:hypothetical protein [Candidatus Venteria ishoeyi]MDM8546513.1 hypothetical protein [Candidatus Venteria ishoeyi]SEH07300.1 Uncharacterised protein [Candidatus Venteria ishoeyi]
MAGLSLKTLAGDLLSLEVNTIVKADMTGSKLPANRREALFKIATLYHSKLEELHCREPVEWDSAGLMSFLELRRRANAGVKQIDQQLLEIDSKDSKQPKHLAEIQAVKEKRVMLYRIASQSEQLVSMFIQRAYHEQADFSLDSYRKARQQAVQDAVEDAYYDKDNANWNNDLKRQDMQQLEDLALDAAELSLLRKIFEIGTERVILQTVINADGDITTRVAERLIINPNEILLQLHNDSVSRSVSFWAGLVTTLGSMAKNLLHGKDGLGGLFK